MTERRPPGASYTDWVEYKIREAQKAGKFDNLAGAGKPLADIDPDEVVALGAAVQADLLTSESPQHDVLLLEARGIGHGEGSSHGPSRLIRLTLFVSQYGLWLSSEDFTSSTSDEAFETSSSRPSSMA